MFVINPYRFGIDYAQRFIDAAGITDGTEQTAIRDLVDDLFFYNLWGKIDIFYPFVGSSADQHSYNLINPAKQQLTWSGGWTQASTGAKGNGINSYSFSDIELDGLTFYSQNSNHQGWYVRNAGNNQGYNGASGGNGNWIGGWDGDAQAKVSGSGNMGVTIARNGNFLATRRGNTDSEHYKNGVSIATSATASSALPGDTQEYELGALHSTGASRSFYHDKEMTYFSLGGGLTDLEAADFNTVISNWNTALSRA